MFDPCMVSLSNYQSPHRDWSNGVMECWSDGGFETQYSNIPILQHSILRARLASEIFLGSLHRVFCAKLLAH